MTLSELLKHFKNFPQIVVFDKNSEEEIYLTEDYVRLYWGYCTLVDYFIYNDGLLNLTIYITDWRF